MTLIKKILKWIEYQKNLPTEQQANEEFLVRYRLDLTLKKLHLK